MIWYWEQIDRSCLFGIITLFFLFPVVLENHAPMFIQYSTVRALCLREREMIGWIGLVCEGLLLFVPMEQQPRFHGVPSPRHLQPKVGYPCKNNNLV